MVAVRSQSEILVNGIVRLVDMHVKSVIENKAAGQMGVYSVTLRTLVTMLVKERDDLSDHVSLLYSRLADAEKKRKVLMVVKEKWRRKAQSIISNRKVEIQ